MHDKFDRIRFENERETMRCFSSLANGRQLDLLEVCAPWDSPLASAVENHGGTVFRMGIHNGFDLGTRAGFLKAVYVLKRLRPRYVHVSPPCFPFSIMQNANQRNSEQIRELEAKRQTGRRILRHCTRLLEIQIMELGSQGGWATADHAVSQEEHDGGLEQPLRALSWKEPSLKKATRLCGGRFRVDGCRHGCKDLKTGQPLQKSFAWLSSSLGIRKALQMTCNHPPGYHLPIEGHRTAASAVYPSQLCERFAQALMKDRSAFLGLVDACQETHAFDECFHEAGQASVQDEERPPNAEGQDPPRESPNPILGEEKSQEDQEIIRKLRVIHANLGHPNKTTMGRLLKEAGVTQKVLQLADQMECTVCRQRGRRAPLRPAAVPAITEPWDTISVDTFWWSSPHKKQGKPQRFCVGVSLFDEGSNYHVVGIVRQGEKPQESITAEEFKTCFRSCWLRCLPKPKRIRYDCEGFFRKLDLFQWLEGQGIRVQAIAAEAPWQLGKHSKHLETVKENASLLALETAADVDVEETFDATLAAKNELHTFRGFAPNQWAFGQNCDRVGSFLQNGEHPVVQQQRSKQVSFEDHMKRKNEARMIFLREDAKLRIQRAAHANIRRAQEFETGQLVYFFRRGRGHGNRYESYWFGPAKVVCVEKTGDPERNQSAGSVVWIVHGTTLYRCAPEQLRVVTHEVQNLSHLFGSKETPSSMLENARQSQQYRDITSESQLVEPDADEAVDEDPNLDGSLVRAQEELSRTLEPIRRLRGKQNVLEHLCPPQRPADQAGQEPASGSGIQREPHSELPRDGSQAAGRDGAEAREVLRGESSGHRGKEGGLHIPAVARRASSKEPQVFGPADLSGASRARGQSASQDSRAQVSEEARRDFDTHVQSKRLALPSREPGLNAQDRDPREAHAGDALRNANNVPNDSGAEGSQSPDPGGSHGSQQSCGRTPESHPTPRGHGSTALRLRASPAVPARMRSRSRHRDHESDSVRWNESLPTGEDAFMTIGEILSSEPEPVLFDSEKECFPVGCARVPAKNRTNHARDGINRGCFSWMPDDCFGEPTVDQEETPIPVNYMVENSEMIEITMIVAPRDVHNQRRNGVQEWVLNQKPKKNAEVKLKTLNEEEKAEFRVAMRSEIDSFLEREAIAIASRHGIDPQKLLNMRWV